MEPGEQAELRAQTDRWFIRQGLPHFIEDYSITSDVLTRAIPFLTLVFVLEAFNTFSEDRGGANEIAPFFVGLAGFFAVWVVINTLRGRKIFQRPDKVGPIELALFLLVPPVLPAIFHDDKVVDSAGVFFFNLFVLGAAYVVTSYGLIPMTRWGIRQMLGQLGDLANLMARALPLLLIFSALLFLTTEIWQVVSSLGAPFFVITALIPFIAGALFLLLRVPSELDAVAKYDSWDAVHELCEGTPMGDVAVADLSEPPESPGLKRRAWLNVGLVMVVSQGIQILLVSLVIGLFYVAFGLFAVSESVQDEWTVSHQVDVIARFTLFGNEAVLSTELLKVAAFIAAFSGLQFTLSAITDALYRQEFFDRAVGGVRQALAVRALYLVSVVRGPESR